MKRSRGFTLIELMMVVAIVGILSVMAAPSINNAMRHRALDQFAHSVGSFVFKTRSLAITQNQFMAVGGNGSYMTLFSYYSGVTYARLPEDPSAFFDPAYTVNSTDWILFNGKGSLVDGNSSPNSFITITCTDTMTGEAIIITVGNSGSMRYSRTN